MKTSASAHRRIAIACALVSLSSCSLPPSAAWRIIRHDGLGSYIAMETGRKPFPPEMQSLLLHNGNRRSPLQTPPAGTSLAANSTYFNKGNDVATPVAPPKTVPASTSRLVFEVSPNSIAVAPSPTAQSTPTNTRTVPKKSPSVKANGKSEITARKDDAPEPKKQSPAVAIAPNKPTAEAATAPKKQAATTASPPKKSVAAANPGPAPKPNAAPAPAKPTVELPYGSPVPGRVGLVHSPYAGKLQLVDVSGLAPGQEVKCPYSGKLFRVPAGDQAAAKKTESAPPAAKAEDEKKQ